MKVETLDHLNFVTDDPNRICEVWEKLSGKSPMFQYDHTKKYGVDETVFIFPHGMQIQKVTDPAGDYGALLDGKKGLHALTFQCVAFDEAIEDMQAMGYDLIRKIVEPTHSLKYAMFDTMADLGFNIEIMTTASMSDNGIDVGVDVQ